MSHGWVFELHLKEHISQSRGTPVLSLTRLSAVSVEQKQTEKTGPKYPVPSFPYNQTECWEEWAGCQGHCFLFGHCSGSKQSSRGSYYRRDNRRFSIIKSALLSIFSRFVVWKPLGAPRGTCWGPSKISLCDTSALFLKRNLLSLLQKSLFVIPAEAGNQVFQGFLDPGLRRGDGFIEFCK